jgi:hypothetical protein
MIKTLVTRYHVIAEDATAEASSFSELSKNLSGRTKDDFCNYQKSRQQLANKVAPLTDMPVGKAARDQQRDVCMFWTSHRSYV